MRRYLLPFIPVVMLAQGPTPLTDAQKLTAARYTIKLRQAQLDYQALYNQLLNQLITQMQSSTQQADLNKALGEYRAMLGNYQKEHKADGCELTDEQAWKCGTPKETGK